MNRLLLSRLTLSLALTACSAAPSPAQPSAPPTLLPAYRVRLVGDADTPVINASVWLCASPLSGFSYPPHAVTDSQGIAAFQGIRPGSYLVATNAPHYDSRGTDVTLWPGSALTRTLGFDRPVLYVGASSPGYTMTIRLEYLWHSGPDLPLPSRAPFPCD
jgi:hypothetical protein